MFLAAAAAAEGRLTDKTIQIFRHSERHWFDFVVLREPPTTMATSSRVISDSSPEVKILHSRTGGPSAPKSIVAESAHSAGKAPSTGVIPPTDLEEECVICLDKPESFRGKLPSCVSVLNPIIAFAVPPIVVEVYMPHKWRLHSPEPLLSLLHSLSSEIDQYLINLSCSCFHLFQDHIFCFDCIKKVKGALHF
jgi:hypothetical protein